MPKVTGPKEITSDGQLRRQRAKVRPAANWDESWQGYYIASNTEGETCHIDCSTASCLRIAASMQRVLEVNDQEETFKALFSVRLEWVEPCLANRHSQIVVKRADGSIDEFIGIVRERPRRDVVVVERVGVPGQPWVEERLRPWDIVRYSEPEGLSIAVPKIRFANAIEAPSILSEDRRLLSTSPAGGVVCVERQYVGSFADKLDLRMFPWDRQLLQIRIVAESPLEELRLVADGRKTWIPHQRAVPQGWRLSEKVANGFSMFETPFDTSWLQTPQLQPRGTVHSEVRITAHMERNPSKYTYTFFSVFFCNLATCICALVKVEDVFSRGVLQFLSLLILFTQRLLQNHHMPRKSYLSVLDSYFLIALLMQLCLILETFYVVLWSGLCHSVVGRCVIGSDEWVPQGRGCSGTVPREAFYCDAQAGRLDNRIYASMSTLWIALNLCLWLPKKFMYKPWGLVYQHCHLDPAVAQATYLGVQKSNDGASSWPGCFSAAPACNSPEKRPLVMTPKTSSMAPLPPPSTLPPRPKYITPGELGKTRPEFYEVSDDPEEGPGAAGKGVVPLLE